jgi:hypothetical protein
MEYPYSKKFGVTSRTRKIIWITSIKGFYLPAFGHKIGTTYWKVGKNSIRNRDLEGRGSFQWKSTGIGGVH